MKNVEIKRIIRDYIKYLLKVSHDFVLNKQNYLTHKTFNNKTIFKMYFNEAIPQKVIYEIFITYIELILYKCACLITKNNSNLIKSHTIKSPS